MFGNKIEQKAFKAEQLFCYICAKGNKMPYEDL
jgi:hypothetical protein